MMNMYILKRLLNVLNAPEEYYSFGKQNDMKKVSIFRRGTNFVVRIRDDRGMSEVVYPEGDEEKAIVAFLCDLAFVI